MFLYYIQQYIQVRIYEIFKVYAGADKSVAVKCMERLKSVELGTLAIEVVPYRPVKLLATSTIIKRTSLCASGLY